MIQCIAHKWLGFVCTKCGMSKREFIFRRMSGGIEKMLIYAVIADTSEDDTALVLIKVAHADDALGCATDQLKKDYPHVDWFKQKLDLIKIPEKFGQNLKQIQKYLLKKIPDCITTNYEL